MAKSVLELAVGTGQWDAGLKKAKAALDNFTQSQGGLQQALANDSDKMQQFVRMMGQMDSTAKTAKGQMNDYKAAIEQLTMQYNRMTDAQKQTIGQDYLQAIDLMKQKYQAVNNEIQEMNRSLSGMKMPDMPEMNGGLFGGGKMDGMLQVLGGNLMTKGIEMAASAVMNFAGEISDCVKQGIELAKQGEGIRIAFERLGRGDILNGLREATHGTVTDIELMKSAVKFNDFKLPVEELGTMLAFAQQKAKDTGQSIDYMVDSIVTGLGRKSLMILDNLGLSAAEVKEKMAETGDMTKAVGEIIREQMAKAGDYVETAADRAARANVDLQNKMEELGRKFAPVEEASNQLWTSMKIGILDIVGDPLARLLNGLTEAGRMRNMKMDSESDFNRMGGSAKVDKMIGNLGNGQGQSAFNLYQRQLKAFDDAINKIKFKIAAFGDHQDSIEKGLVEDLQAQLNAMQRMRAEYVKRAQDLHNQASQNIANNNKAESISIESLKKKLKELEEERKKAVRSGDQEKVDFLTKKISETKTNLGYLDPNAIKTTHKEPPQEQAQKAVEAALLSYNQSIEKAKMSLDNGTATEADTKKKLLSAEEQLWTAYGKAYATYNDPAYKTAQDESAKRIKELGGEVVKAVEAQKKQEQATRELEAAQKKLADAQRELATARNSGKLSDIYSAEKKVATAQGEVTRLESGQPLAIPYEKTVTIKANTENITAQIAHLKEQMGNLEIGSIAFDKTQESLVDMTTLQSLINTQLKAGLKIDQTVTSDLMQQILGGQNIDDKAWQAFVDEINQKLAELELPPIKLNFQTGDVAKDAKAAAKEWQAAGSAIQSVGSAMTQIEDPAAKVLGTVAQAIASVALAASQAMAAKDTTASGWAWIGAAAAITGTMISTIAAIKSATAGAYAEGGIIPGTHYSSDMQLAEVNAGELILNRSQQNTIANQLQGGTLGNLHLSATVSGEQIRLVLNNNGKRTGRGEYLTTRFS